MTPEYGARRVDNATFLTVVLHSRWFRRDALTAHRLMNPVEPIELVQLPPAVPQSSLCEYRLSQVLPSFSCLFSRIARSA